MAEMTPRANILSIAAQARASQPRARGLQVTSAGVQPTKRNWIHHRFEVHAVGLVVAGRGAYQVNDGKIHTVEAPCVFSVYPGPAFHYGPAEGSTWHEHHVCLTGSKLKDWYRAGWLFNDGRVHPVGEINDALEQHRQLVEVMRRGAPGDPDRAVAIAQRLLVEIYYARSARKQPAAITPAINRIMTYCRQHLADPIDFEALARKNAMSYSHLRQQIRRTTGHPPAKYLTQLRCEAALKRLGESDLSIKQIAAEVGITDPYTFSRTFKRCVGVSPRAYRRQTAPWR